MRFLLFFLFCSLGTSQALPSFLEQTPVVSSKEVLDWVSPTQASPVTSVESLLAKLPEAYRTYFVLQYDSHSNHLSDTTHPRVIFFGPDAKLLLAFSGLPSDPHFNTVEMIEYDPPAATYHFYSIHFEENQKVSVEIDPSDCKRCHGPDPKPNWEPYNLWPGAYGSLHDSILERSSEKEAFINFLNHIPSSPRYQFLPQPFHVESEDSLGNKNFYLLTAGVGPGSTLSMLLSSLNLDRIAKKIVQSPSHSRYRPAITAALLGCPEKIEDFLPSDLKENHAISFDTVFLETKNLMEKDLARKKRVLIDYLSVSEDTVLEKANLFGFRDLEIERIARLRFLLQKRKEPVGFDRWPLSISKTSLDFNDGLTGLENLLGHYLPHAYQNNDPIKQAIRVAKFPFSFTSFEPKSQSHPAGEKDPKSYRIYSFSLVKSPKTACELLLKEAKALSFSQ